MQNPWLDLPAFPPFIVPVDADLLTRHGRFPPGRCELKLDLLPQPWTGNVNTAEVFMLALNPGFSPDDYLEVRNPDYAEQWCLAPLIVWRPCCHLPTYGVVAVAAVEMAICRGS